MYGKLPPQALQLEDALLGAILLQGTQALDQVINILPGPHAFYQDHAQKIYAAAINLFKSGRQIDLLTMAEQLRKQNELELVGGDYFLTGLTMNVVSSGHIETHAYFITEKYMAREVIRIGGELVRYGYEDATDVFDLLERGEDELYKLSHTGISKEVKHVSSVVLDVSLAIDEQRESDLDYSGIISGYPELDEIIGGWQPGNLVILAARPGVGKTAFALELCMACAGRKQYGGPAAFFSLEMSEAEPVKRMISNVADVELIKILRPKRMDPEEMEKLSVGTAKLAAMPFFIDDTAGLSVFELRAKARRLKQKHDIQMIIIDYLQLMSGDGQGGNREQEISKITRELKELAKELRIPIIALSQLNRLSTQRGAGAAPQLSDLRESGAIEQDADIVLFLTRPNKEDLKQRPHLAGMAMLDVAKNRSGVTGEVILKAELAYQRFKPLDGPDFEAYKSGEQASKWKKIPGGGTALAHEQQQNYQEPGLPANFVPDDLPF